MRSGLKARRRLGGLVPFQADAIGWLDAMSLVEAGLANGDPVTAWASRFNPATASASQAGVGAIPTFVANVDSSGKPGVSFNGTSHFMVLGDAWKLPSNGKYTLYTVVRRGGTASSTIVGWYNQSANQVGFYVLFLSTDRTFYGVGTSQNNTVTTPNFALNTRKVITLTNFDAGAGLSVHINNTQGFVNASNGTQSALTSPTMGARYATSAGTTVEQFMAGTIQCVLAYSTVHTATERVAVHTFLYDRYGVVP